MCQRCGQTQRQYLPAAVPATLAATILIISLVTVISGINATALSSPRILFVMGREGWLPSWVTSVNRGGTPTVALFLGTVVASALVLSGGFETPIAIASFLFVSVYLSGFISLFVLRVKEPDRPRPFKAWAYPWGNLFVLLTFAALLIGSIIADLKDALFTLVFVALTVPVYFLIPKSKSPVPQQVALQIPDSGTRLADPSLRLVQRASG
jgi:basic amino acid/polyamine antiporter, APA family